MPKFITIGYGDEAGYSKTPEALRNMAHAHDKELQDHGVLMGMAGTPTQVRNTAGFHIETQKGPYMSSKLPVAGFAVIEADSLEAAIQMVSTTPCAVAYGVVEVWPLKEN